MKYDGHWFDIARRMDALSYKGDRINFEIYQKLAYNAMRLGVKAKKMMELHDKKKK